MRVDHETDQRAFRLGREQVRFDREQWIDDRGRAMSTQPRR